MQLNVSPGNQPRSLAERKGGCHGGNNGKHVCIYIYIVRYPVVKLCILLYVYIILIHVIYNRPVVIYIYVYKNIYSQRKDMYNCWRSNLSNTNFKNNHTHNSHNHIYMVVDQNSFTPERPFFANKNFTFAKLSRTPCLSFAGPMLANNTSYEDSFTTCQITPENHGSLLGSLLNMQLASRNPFSGQILLCKVYWPTPFNMHFDFRPLFRITFAELSRKYPYSQTPAISMQGVHWRKAKTRGLGVWLSQSLTFGNLATATRILWCPSSAGPRAAVGGCPLHIMMIIPNFSETFAK